MCVSITLTMIVPCPNAELACTIHIIGVFALWIRVVDAGRWLRRAFICHGLLCTGPARQRGARGKKNGMQCPFCILIDVLHIYTGLAGQLRSARPGKAATPRKPRMVSMKSGERVASEAKC